MISCKSHRYTGGRTTLLVFVTTQTSPFTSFLLGLRIVLFLLLVGCGFIRLDTAFGFSHLLPSSLSSTTTTTTRSSALLSTLLSYNSNAWMLWSHQDSSITSLPRISDPDDVGDNINNKHKEVVVDEQPPPSVKRGGSSSDILSTLDGQGLSPAHQERILKYLQQSGLVEDNDYDDDNDSNNRERSLSCSSLILLAQDFVERPEVLSALLISDFGFPPLVAHQTRAMAFSLIRHRKKNGSSSTANPPLLQRDISNSSSDTNTDDDTAVITTTTGTNGTDHESVPPPKDHNDSVALDSKNRQRLSTERADDGILSNNNSNSNNNNNNKHSDKEFQSTIVNERAKKRKMAKAGDYSYGLPIDYAVQYPQLGSELDEYYRFMTQPSTYSQEDPIRPATAKVYLLHARLFLGWCINNNDNQHHHSKNEQNGEGKHDLSPNHRNSNRTTVSLFEIIPNKEKDSANQIIQFILWLRSRDVSVSYEANFLRGIIKLLKFRFAKTSQSDPMSGKTTFDDIPIIREVRKLHRDANKRQKGAPRSSDEQKKWITWPDYLRVIQHCKEEVIELRNNYLLLSGTSQLRYAPTDIDRRYSLEQQRVAGAYQRYLILAIFASIPDRQRTIRELEVGRTLVKDGETGYWTVKHGPDDYKTGRHYGERPAMQLAEELTPTIDDFLENYRPALLPSTNALFVQSRTGRPMTADSIFQRVTRSCFKYTGKRTNPHMLRDIIVTHVRETDASEKELEALALFMGHSISMQRDSYDRRTLTTKIAPAVKLMRSVNNHNNNKNSNNKTG
jgi:integrase